MIWYISRVQNNSVYCTYLQFLSAICSTFLVKALQASSEDQIETSPPKETVPSEQLWVEKYAPSSFTELLSNEHTNREVMQHLSMPS